MWSIPEILEEMADPASYLRKIEDLKQHYLRLSEQYFSQKNLKGM
jgi:hypothetical protein